MAPTDEEAIDDEEGTEWMTDELDMLDNDGVGEPERKEDTGDMTGEEGV